MDGDTIVIKKENTWTSIVEASDPEVDDSTGEEEDQICIATKTDGKPCQGIKYKDNDYCYNHLIAQKTRPKGRPRKTATDIIITQPQPQSSQNIQPQSSQNIQPPSRVPSPKTASSSLLEKLTQRLKEKVDGLDDEMKVLLKMLL